MILRFAWDTNTTEPGHVTSVQWEQDLIKYYVFFSKTYEQKLLPSHMVLINVSMDAQGSSGASIFTLALFWNFTCVARLEICTHLYGTLVPNFTLITPPIFKYVKLVS
jgi:hypothetical protein